MAGASASPSRRTILITVMGTRGDVQPFVALGRHLQEARGWRVVLAAPPEFRGFISGHGLEHEDIGISLQHAINASPQGRALRKASMFTAFQATSDFFRLPLLESWFAAARRLLLGLRPAVLLLTSFVAMSGAAALPEILGLPTRVVMAHTIPMHATGEFGMPLAGTGFSAPTAWLNRLQWRSLDLMVAQTLHLPRAQGIVDQAIAAAEASHAAAVSPGSSSEGGAAAGGGRLGHADSISAEAAVAAAADMEAAHALLVARTRLQRGLAPAPVPTLYIWSPSLLPKPADWPANCHVVGPLLLRRTQQAPAPAPAAPAPAAAPALAPLPAPLPVPALELPPMAVLPAVTTRAARSSSSGDAAGLMPRTPLVPAPAATPAARNDSSSPPASPADEPQPAAAAGLQLALPPPGAAPAPAPAPAAAALAAAALPAAAAAGPPEWEGLPAGLQAYLDRAQRRSLPVVYIGLGSMLATVFEPEEVDRLIAAMVQAAKQAAAELPLCAIIHAAASSPPPSGGGAGGSAVGTASAAGAAGAGGAPSLRTAGLARLQGMDSSGGAYFLLQQPVDHALLLPQVDFCVHHGGAGTTQAVLLAGKPALVVPCVPSSDQPFWADLVARRGLGPPSWFPVKQLTAERLADGILDGLRGLRRYGAAAEQLSVEMAQEGDGVAAAAAVIEAAALV